jgi:PAS domain S-box-containing protein
MSARMESLQEQTRDVILDSIVEGVFTVDGDWKITSFNRAAEEITGVSSEDAIGQSCCDVFHANICESECALRETLRSGNPVVCKPIYIVTADGRRIPVSISAATLQDQHGNVIGGVETFRDLSVIEQLRKELQDKYTFADIVARSAVMRRFLKVLPQLAESSSTVLIEGASGTGKELVARAIHDLSPRRDKRFVAINCSALPDTLLESELFGYKAGAFTDARMDKPGRFTLAEGGTIFLDEIGDVSPAMQVKLLRVLQERVVEPLGSVDPVDIDVRVIAATNRNLGKLVKQGRFREDLYYRVNVVRLELPPLRDRREDIPLLVGHFVAKLNRLQQKNVAGVSEETLAILLEHDYPGNVRELENIVEHAFVLCRTGLIEPRHLPLTLQSGSEHELGSAKSSLSLAVLETQHINDALRRHAGNRRAAARELGIHPSTLFRKIKLLDIELPPQDGRSTRVRSGNGQGTGES